MNKEMQKLMNKVDNAFTEAQLEAMDEAVTKYMDQVYAQLGLGRQNITGEKRRDPRQAEG